MTIVTGTSKDTSTKVAKDTNKKTKRVGKATVVFSSRPACTSAASIVGPMEGEGPLGELFDHVTEDDLLGKKSWEQAEQQMLQDACQLAANKANISMNDVDLIFSGDLLNQIVSSSFASRQLDRPYMGLFSACASWAQALLLAATMVDGNYFDKVMAAVCSHHNTAERQYRFPVEFGNQRPPTAQWTVTGAGAALIESGDGEGPRLTHGTIGRVVDMGVKDPYDMGSAMAPAAADTIIQHFEDTGRKPEDYDLILTGDLSRVGLPICSDLLIRAGYDAGDRLEDCGIMIYDNEKQDVLAGASGAGCSAVVFNAVIYPRLIRKEIHRVLFVATGSLHSPLTFEQGETMPCIAHAVVWEA